MQQRVIIDKTTNSRPIKKDEVKENSVSNKRKVNLYEHDFEAVVSEKDPMTGRYRATVNYLGYTDSVGIADGIDEDDAIDNAVRKILISTPLEAVKCLYD